MSSRIKPILLFVCATAGLLAACDPTLLGGDRLTAGQRHAAIGGNPATGGNGLDPARLVDAFPR